MDENYRWLIASLLDVNDELHVRLDVQDDHVVVAGDNYLSLEDACDLCDASATFKKALGARLAAIQSILGVEVAA